ncbi:hypothetical protein LAZ67_16002016 [Cordylochernes scorpioides]|uniref:Integrase catalytic domain-containing protein n=1 Tax=Cordylochernes scorpioides TaxID=51811 RepID=A0ABY6LBP1_9ARAC|nr:hypothetical protein LAZ67_16002016 [Cordylochernes scorpioides]
MSYVLRFIGKLKKQLTEKGPLKVSELEFAEKILVKVIQEMVSIERLSSIKGLKIFKNSEGLWSSIHFVNIKGKIWIIRGRKTIKKIISKCIVCKRFKEKALQRPMAALPESRIGIGKPFKITGVDLLGPLYLKDSRKAWVAAYTCAVYRAIHLELVENLEAGAFMMALHRFICRRGRPEKIYSDNGTVTTTKIEMIGAEEYDEKAVMKELESTAHYEKMYSAVLIRIDRILKAQVEKNILLKKVEKQWPNSEPTIDQQEVCSEERIVNTNINLNVDCKDWLLKRRSDYHLKIRIMSYVLRFIGKLKKQLTEKGPLKVSELEFAEKILVKVIQEMVSIERLSSIKGLKIFKNSEGLWSSIHFVNIKGKIWIIRGRKTIKKIISKCIVCKRFKEKALQRPMAALPESRIGIGKPFKITGVDLLGPLYLKDSRKAWVAAYTCAVYRAIQLELVENLEAGAFMMALHRFICRRGRPEKIYSDNGTVTTTKAVMKELESTAHYEKMYSAVLIRIDRILKAQVEKNILLKKVEKLKLRKSILLKKVKRLKLRKSILLKKVKRLKLRKKSKKAQVEKKYFVEESEKSQVEKNSVVETEESHKTEVEKKSVVEESEKSQVEKNSVVETEESHKYEVEKKSVVKESEKAQVEKKSVVEESDKAQVEKKSVVEESEKSQVEKRSVVEVDESHKAEVKKKSVEADENGKAEIDKRSVIESESAEPLKKEEDVIADSGMELRQWETTETSNLRDGNDTKVLELLWNRKTDTLNCEISLSVIIRRIYLSLGQELFDTIGFYLPVIAPKILLQKTWNRASGWDDPLGKDIREATSIGTNFSKLNRIFKNLNWAKIEKESSNERIHWIFIPPAAPWWGGFWERMVRTIKEMLIKMLGHRKLNYVQLQTILCEIEHLIDNRPLTYVSEDDNDLKPLTPNEFLQNGPEPSFPELENLKPEMLHEKYKKLGQLKKELKRRFLKEYLGTLIQKSENFDRRHLK